MSKLCMECAYLRPEDGFCHKKKDPVGAFEVHEDCFKPKEQKTQFIEVQEPKQRCRVCGRDLPMSAFQKNKKSKSGHLFTCKECMSKKISKSVNSAKTETADNIRPIDDISLDRFSDEVLEVELRMRGFPVKDETLVDELRRRGWKVTCTKTIEL